MKQPVPARGHAPRPDAAHRGHAGPAPKADLRVRYYYRMKPQRAYPLVVEVPRGSGPSSPVPDPVVVRPLIPGAHVVPAEQALDVNRPGEQVTFYVTPLARGRLPSPRVEVLQHGHPVGTIGLRMKSVTQRMTWLLLLLTLLVPALVYYYTRVRPLSAVIPHKLVNPDLGEPADEKKKEGEGEKKARPDDADRGAAAPAGAARLLARADQDEKADKADEKKDDKSGARPAEGPRGPGRQGPMGANPRPDMGPAGPGAPAGRPEVAAPQAHEMALPETPGKVLEYYITQEAKNDFPDVPVLTDKIVPPVASYLGQGYDIACNMPGVYLWVGLVLLGLTVISWWLHGSRRSSRRARVDLTATPAGTAQETLPLGPAGARPVSVEPG